MVRINFYIQDKEVDVIEHLNSQLNKSGYIVNLIKQDMNCEDKLSRDQIIELIKKYSDSQSSVEDTEIQGFIQDSFQF